MARKRQKKRAVEGGFELADSEKDRVASALWGNPANLEVYDPRAGSRVPAGGAWALITRKLPPLEHNLDREMRVGRIFFVEHLGNADEAGFLPDGSYKVICRSPWGDLCLMPYEYSVVPVADILSMWSAEELVFHPLRVDDARFNEIAFYARSRGIALGDAAAMALGTLAGSGVGWFEPRPDLAEECEAMEARVHHPWLTRFGPAPGAF